MPKCISFLSLKKSNNAFQYAPTINISPKEKKVKGHIFLETEKKTIIKKKKNGRSIKNGIHLTTFARILCTVSHHS